MEEQERNIHRALQRRVNLHDLNEINQNFNDLTVSRGAFENFCHQAEARLQGPGSADERHNLKLDRLIILHQVNKRIDILNRALRSLGQRSFEHVRLEDRDSLASVMPAGGAGVPEGYSVIDSTYTSTVETLDWDVSLDSSDDSDFVPPRPRRRSRSLSPSGLMARLDVNEQEDAVFEGEGAVGFDERYALAPPPSPARNLYENLVPRLERNPLAVAAPDHTISSSEVNVDRDRLPSPPVPAPRRLIRRTRDHVSRERHGHLGLVRHSSPLRTRREHGAVSRRPHRPSSTDPSSRSHVSVLTDFRVDPHDSDSTRRRERPSHTEAMCDVNYFLTKKDLFTPPREPFSGNRESFSTWSQHLYDNMAKVNLTGMDKLRILEIHTTGEAREIVSNFMGLVDAEDYGAAFLAAKKALADKYTIVGRKGEHLQRKVENFPPMPREDPDLIFKLKNLCDGVMVALQCSRGRSTGLEKYDREEGLTELALKLTPELCRLWQGRAYKFLSRTDRVPGLAEFCAFLNDQYQKTNHSFFKGLLPKTSKPPRSERAAVPAPTMRSYRASEVAPPGVREDRSEEGSRRTPYCHLHKHNEHTLTSCPEFLEMDGSRKKQFLNRLNLCYRCGRHYYSGRCRARVSCVTCNNTSHASELHDVPGNVRVSTPEDNPAPPGPGDSTVASTRADTSTVETPRPTGGREPLVGLVACTSTEPNANQVRFSPTFLVEVGHDSTDAVVRCYVMVDTHSYHTFCDKKLADALSLPTPYAEYNLATLAGHKTFIKGHEVSGLKVRGIRGGDWFYLPYTFTNPNIMEARSERASRDIVEKIEHLSQFSSNFESEDHVSTTQLLIGLDAPELLWSEPHGTMAPYACSTPLGWAVLGSVPKDIIPPHCLSRKEESPRMAYCTRVVNHHSYIASPEFLPRHAPWESRTGVFDVRLDDEEVTWSQEEQKFIDMMKSGMRITEAGQIELPLPLKDEERKIPNCQAAVYYRTKSFLDKAKRDQSHLENVVAAMQKSIDFNHVEPVPLEEIDKNEKCWWLPIFGVSHPRKQAVRLVYDASGTFKGVSLNSMLYCGPDLNNSLRGVLIHLRVHEVAFMFDIQHMFNCFLVPKRHQDVSISLVEREQSIQRTCSVPSSYTSLRRQ